MNNLEYLTKLNTSIIEKFDNFGSLTEQDINPTTLELARQAIETIIKRQNENI